VPGIRRRTLTDPCWILVKFCIDFLCKPLPNKREFHENILIGIHSLLKGVNGFLFLLYFFFVDSDKIHVEDLRLMVLNIFEFREKWCIER